MKKEEYLKVLDVLESLKYEMSQEEVQNIFSKIVRENIKGNFLIFGRRIFVKKSEFDKRAKCA